MTTEERSGKLALGIVSGAITVFITVLFYVSVALESFPLFVTAIICTFICWGWLWYLLGSRFRVLPTLNILWLAVGILLLGVATAVAGWVFAEGHSNSATGWRFEGKNVDEVAMCGFVIAVTGLSGLVFVALGLVRLLARRKGT